MSDKQLQRVAEGVADIGHATVRRTLSPRIAQKTGSPVIARLMNISLENGASPEKLADLLAQAKYVTSIDHSSLLTATKPLKEEDSHEGRVHRFKHCSADWQPSETATLPRHAPENRLCA